MFCSKATNLKFEFGLVVLLLEDCYLSSTKSIIDFGLFLCYNVFGLFCQFLNGYVKDKL